MSPATRLGYVHLTIADLDRQTRFYTQILGFNLHWREGSDAALGTETEVLLRLTEDHAASRVQNTSGMYHFAILYPSRKELARAMARLFALRYPNAPTDHGISLTTYLDDPEGNNIELYIRTLDRATYDIVNGQPVVHYTDGRIGTGRDHLDIEALFRELDEGESLDLPLPQGTRIGHMHLYVADLDATMNFYHNILGYQEGPVALGFRMGEVGLDERQPHVIAFNTWKGTGIPPAPADALGLRYFTVVLPSAGELQRLVDHIQAMGWPTEETPDGICVRGPSQICLVLTEHMPSIK